jgi:hypothetical protein
MAESQSVRGEIAEHRPTRRAAVIRYLTRRYPGRRTGAGRVALLMLAVSVLVACESSAGDGTATTTTSPPAATATTTAAKLVECTDVLAAGSMFADTVTRFVDGSATLDEVRSAGAGLRTAVQEAGATVSGEVQARMNDLESALDNLQAALQQSPPQVESVRAAGRQVVSALSALGSPCAATQPTTT